MSLAIARNFEDPPELKPDATAESGVVYRWESANRLRYTWLLPDGYDPSQPTDVTVILHGTGLDYRWGHWNNPIGVFRPQDIVLSVDGPTPDNKTRLFMGEKDDAEAFKVFLSEMREMFSIDDIFLYGHSQGGFFAIYFAGEHPDLVDGAVAHDALAGVAAVQHTSGGAFGAVRRRVFADDGSVAMTWLDRAAFIGAG